MDGGRIRIRKNKKKKTKKGRKKYYTDWREPKLLITYIIGEDGKKIKTIDPILDGFLNGPDDIFDLLYYYLNNLHLSKESQVLFIADGALWIWKRVSKLFNRFLSCSRTFKSICSNVKY